MSSSILLPSSSSASRLSLTLMSSRRSLLQHGIPRCSISSSNRTLNISKNSSSSYHGGLCPFRTFSSSSGGVGTVNNTYHGLEPNNRLNDVRIRPSASNSTVRRRRLQQQQQGRGQQVGEASVGLFNSRSSNNNYNNTLSNDNTQASPSTTVIANLATDTTAQHIQPRAANTPKFYDLISYQQDELKRLREEKLYLKQKAALALQQRIQHKEQQKRDKQQQQQLQRREQQQQLNRSTTVHRKRSKSVSQQRRQQQLQQEQSNINNFDMLKSVVQKASTSPSLSSSSLSTYSEDVSSPLADNDVAAVTKTLTVAEYLSSVLPSSLSSSVSSSTTTTSNRFKDKRQKQLDKMHQQQLRQQQQQQQQQTLAFPFFNMPMDITASAESAKAAAAAFAKNNSTEKTTTNTTEHPNQHQQHDQLVVPTSSWLLIHGIPPVSSLDSVIQSIQVALTKEAHDNGLDGLVDLDATISISSFRYDGPFSFSGKLPILSKDNNNNNSADYDSSINDKDTSNSDNHDKDQDDTTQSTNTANTTKTTSSSNALSNDASSSFIDKAHMVISPFGRPMGWKLRFKNRSMVFAILMHHYRQLSSKGDGCGLTLLGSRRRVKVVEYHPTPPPSSSSSTEEDDHDYSDSSSVASSRNKEEGSNSNDRRKKKQQSLLSSLFMDQSYDTSLLSDATIRVENCPPDTTEVLLMNFFSRYDLLDHNLVPIVHQQESNTPASENGTTTTTSPSIHLWKSSAVEGIATNPPIHGTWLVHFADPSWARAAVREKQASTLKGYTLLLSQYPKQML